jgi:hypothetical protein
MAPLLSEYRWLLLDTAARMLFYVIRAINLTQLRCLAAAAIARIQKRTSKQATCKEPSVIGMEDRHVTFGVDEALRNVYYESTTNQYRTSKFWMRT